MNKYRTHNCNELTQDNSEQEIMLSGWINKKRDHGNLLFIDLRDNYGITQCIINKSNESFELLEKIQLESVIKIKGKVIKRVDRSYGKIFEFIYKIDRISLKKKKSIDFKIINEALEE